VGLGAHSQHQLQEDKAGGLPRPAKIPNETQKTCAGVDGDPRGGGDSRALPLLPTGGRPWRARAGEGDRPGGGLRFNMAILEYQLIL
jgi:hypothetical protein